MQETIHAFQAQLKNKLQYKASSKVSPDAFLYKAFKFFDLYNNGYLAKPDFFKAIAKCGVVVDTHDMESVYKHYDSHNDGNIHYKQFIEGLLFNDTSSQNSNSIELSQSKLGQSVRVQQSNPQQKNINNSRKSTQNQNNLKESNINRIYNNAETYPQVADLTKRILRQKKIFCLLQLGNNIKNFDPNKTHKIPVDILLKELNFLNKYNLQTILSEFNHQKQNRQINYAQFIYNLKGELEEDRLAIIQHAFEILNSRNQKQVAIQKVIAEFKYPQYLQDFKQSIQLYCRFQAIDDGVFTDQDFIDFFGFLSFYFSHSQHFTAFVSKAYLQKFQTKSNYSHSSNRSREFQRQSNRVVLNESNKNNGDFRKNKQENNQQTYERQPQQKQVNLVGSQKKSVSRHSQIDKKSSTTSFYIKQVQLIVIRVKKRLASKGTKGYLVFEKALKQADCDHDGLVSLQEFKRVIYDLKIDITPTEATLLFDVFDPEATGLISYSQLLNTLKGQMPNHRRSFLQRVWGLIKEDPAYTTFANIKHCLNFRGHPDIQTGRRYDDDVFKELQETLLLIQDLNQTPRNQRISKQQFQEYFQNLSLSVSEDQLFQSILQNFWRMISTMNIQQQYAGSRKIFDHNKKSYLMDHHRYAVKGGSVSQNAPFGTSVQPTNYFTEHHKL